jgi:hypothetical protein
MEPEPLPPDLRELEEQLARRPLPEPAADFRARVLVAVNAASPTESAHGTSWRRLLPVAAALMLVLNLALSVENGMRFHHLDELESQTPAPAGWTGSMIPPRAAGSEDSFDSMASIALANMKPAPDVGEIKLEYLWR